MRLSRTRRWLVPLLAALAMPAASAAPASAASSLSTSTAICVPTNGVSTRPGDSIDCTLSAIASGDNAQSVTADTAVPAKTTFNPLDPFNHQLSIPNPAQPTQLFADAVQLGLLTPGLTKQVFARFQIASDGSAVPGDSIQQSWTLHAANAPDAVVTSNVVKVSPPLADLTPSTVTCVDRDGPPLLPGDLVDCTAQLVDMAQHEDATSVQAQVTLPPEASWIAGGDESFHTGQYLFWPTAFFPKGVPSGVVVAPPMHFSFKISDTVAGGTHLSPVVSVNYLSSPSNVVGYKGVSTELVTAAGPALVSGSLTCADGNAPPLLPGDAIGCSLTVRNAPGREDATSVTTSGPVPPGTTLTAGATDSSGAIFFGTSILGSLPADTFKTTAFRLRVNPETAPGTFITPALTIAGTSVPSNTPISVPVSASPLLVASPAPAPVAAVAAPPKPAVTPVKAPKICASRRVVVVNVRPPRGKHWKSVTVGFSTKSVKAKRVKGSIGYFRARLVFQGLPKGPLTVRITGRTTAGKTVHRTRTYHLCVPRAK